jgi:hypothetical protein
MTAFDGTNWGKVSRSPVFSDRLRKDCIYQILTHTTLFSTFAVKDGISPALTARLGKLPKSLNHAYLLAVGEGVFGLYQWGSLFL